MFSHVYFEGEQPEMTMSETYYEEKGFESSSCPVKFKNKSILVKPDIR